MKKPKSLVRVTINQCYQPGTNYLTKLTDPSFLSFQCQNETSQYFYPHIDAVLNWQWSEKPTSHRNNFVMISSMRLGCWCDNTMLKHSVPEKNFRSSCHCNISGARRPYFRYIVNDQQTSPLIQCETRRSVAKWWQSWQLNNVWIWHIHQNVLLKIQLTSLILQTT